ncbi:kinase suppressor of Ras 2-like isoform X1 [Temnothorax curvispinosus]|uniref:Kinase suppressor of Ras 2-like isoform X1 n=2 Tax=Temnothorax curvispinosus TaxID=300111 RepID=A0A6J1QZC0_9HYME|nr:kinase suppressor of Ras 2-like isoform X1 [Temnothorax curvispinosus]
MLISGLVIRRSGDDKRPDGGIKRGRRYARQVRARARIDENSRVGLAVARGMAAYGDVESVRRTLDVAQTMINFTADQLDDLRTQCSVTAELTQQEIRMLEGKLIKLYCKQLVAKARLANPLPSDIIEYPSLQQWLRVVGLTQESIQMVCFKVNTLEDLREKSEHELNSMLNKNCIYYKEECRRLRKALSNLWRYMDILIKGDTENDSDLYWDSWDSYHLRKEICSKPILSRQRCSIPSESSIPYHNNNNDVLPAASASLILSSPPCISSLLKQEREIKFPSTPPPCKKQLISVQNSPSEVFPLAKSKSHESQLASRPDSMQLDNDDTLSSFRSDFPIKNKSNFSVRRNLPTEQSLDYGTTDYGREESLLSNCNSPVKSPIKSPVKSPIKSPVKSPIKSFFKPPPICTTNAESDDNLAGSETSLNVPKSPCTPVSRGMSHIIAHRFTRSFNVMTVCDYCEKPMFMNTLKCKECKYRCHRECGSKVPPSCGLPRGFYAEFKRTMQSESNLLNVSPVLKRPAATSSNNANLLPPLNRKDRRLSYTQSSMNIPCQGDSSLNTLRYNRSTPSSPALLSATISHNTHTFLKQFHFPDVLIRKEVLSEKLQEMKYRSELAISSDKRRKSDTDDKYDRRLSVSEYNISDSEEIPKSTDSQESLSSDSEVLAAGVTYRCPRQNSMTMGQDWDIPYDELKIIKQIGKGRFATVHRGFWHGDIAIKVLNIFSFYSEDDKILETFKLEVAACRIARHDNLILFLGVCMKPQLALVTSLSRGTTLYTHLHLGGDRYTLAEMNFIAQQICQGMKYLHSREIIHKDLRSKNVFIENRKVLISDFGLFNITKLCHGNRKGEALNIPPGWLCYLAPEIIRRLRPLNRGQDKIPYSIGSDVYAFGTIWYELLCSEWPFRGQPTEAIVWQVGKGMKQSLANLQASRDVKDILMHCWSYHPTKRLDFIEIINLLKRLPRKMLARSSSNPTNCSRSAESMF